MHDYDEQRRTEQCTQQYIWSGTWARCIVLLKLIRHETSRGLFATAELIVQFTRQCACALKPEVKRFTISVWEIHSWFKPYSNRLRYHSATVKIKQQRVHNRGIHSGVTDGWDDMPRPDLIQREPMSAYVHGGRQSISSNYYVIQPRNCVLVWVIESRLSGWRGGYNGGPAPFRLVQRVASFRPYHVTGSALSVVGPSLTLPVPDKSPRPGRRSAATVSDNRFRRCHSAHTAQ